MLCLQILQTSENVLSSLRRKHLSGSAGLQAFVQLTAQARFRLPSFRTLCFAACTIRWHLNISVRMRDCPRSAASRQRTLSPAMPRSQSVTAHLRSLSLCRSSPPISLTLWSALPPPPRSVFLKRLSKTTAECFLSESSSSRYLLFSEGFALVCS